MVEEYEEEAFFDGDDSLRVPAERLDAVIKLFCTHTEPNYSLPWQMRRQTLSIADRLCALREAPAHERALR